MAIAPHVAHPLPADIAGQKGLEPVPSLAHGLVANVDAALEQQVFDIPQREREANVHHDYEPDHLW